MRHSESFTAIAAALAKASAEFPPIERNRTVTVTTRSGGSYQFTYATLDAIIGAVRPALAKNGLVLVQSEVWEEVNVYGDGGVISEVQRELMMETRLLHSSGEWLANTTPVLVQSGENTAQAHGSGITYSRRYGVSQLLCLVAEEDDDGNAAGGGEITRTRAAGGARNGGAVISEKQAGLLRVRLSEIGGHEENLARLFGVDDVASLPRSKMDAAMAEIQKKNPALFNADAASDGNGSGGSTAIARAKAAHDRVVAANHDSVMLIRYHLGEVRDEAVERFAESMELPARDPARAAAEWFEFTDEEKSDLWLATSKGGWFTTKEREALKAAAAAANSQKKD